MLELKNWDRMAEFRGVVVCKVHFPRARTPNFFMGCGMVDLGE